MTYEVNASLWEGAADDFVTAVALIKSSVKYDVSVVDLKAAKYWMEVAVSMLRSAADGYERGIG